MYLTLLYHAYIFEHQHPSLANECSIIMYTVIFLISLGNHVVWARIISLSAFSFFTQQHIHDVTSGSGTLILSPALLHITWYRLHKRKIKDIIKVRNWHPYFFWTECNVYNSDNKTFGLWFTTKRRYVVKKLRFIFVWFI